MAPPKKKRKKNTASFNRLPAPKNAVCTLNEISPGLVYTFVSQQGPVHLPTFTVSVQVRSIFLFIVVSVAIFGFQKVFSVSLLL